MKNGTLLILAFAIVALGRPAHAGFFDFQEAEPKAPSAPQARFTTKKEIQLAKSVIAEVPVKDTCAPSLTEGDDGIFRRTDYCHLANPTRPNGFLSKGYDVPASFLKGFTEGDVRSKWQDVQQVKVPEFDGRKLEVPLDLLKLLNLKSAQAWEKVLGCAGGDPDQARELYRTAHFDCEEQSSIRSLLADVRSSIPSLAASVEAALFLDKNALEDKLREAGEKRKAYNEDVVFQDTERFMREYPKVLKEQIDLEVLQRSVLYTDIVRLLEEYVPKMPRFHPLLVQLLLEEILAYPNKSERRGETVLLQMALLLNYVEDRGCSTMGLWPSANRAAAEAFGNHATEFAFYLGNPKRALIPSLVMVDCPMKRSRKPFTLSWRSRYTITPAEAEDMMRLNDVYGRGRAEVWRELREVRERHLLPAKP